MEGRGGEVGIDPETEKKLIDEEIKSAIDPDFRLKRAAKGLAAARMEEAARKGNGGPVEDHGDAAETAAALASEGVPAEEAARLATERKGVVVVKPGEQKIEKRKYTVLPDGTIVTDPDGEFDTLTDAMVAASNLRQKDRPTYYYQDPESGEFKEAQGPVMLRQPQPPQVWQIMPDGEVKMHQAGEPVVIKMQPPPSGSPPPQKAWLINSKDGTVEEWEPGKPLVIMKEVESQPPPSQPMFPVQMMDGEGKPVGGAIPLPMPQYLEYYNGMQGIRHAQERHEGLLGLAKMLREDVLPKVVGAIENTWGKSSSENLRSVECDQCGKLFQVPRDISLDQVVCPNPECPSHRG